MDGHRFDHLTLQLTRMLSRRRFGGVLAACGLGAGLRRAAETDAKKRRSKNKKKCKNGTTKCGKACVNTQTSNQHCGGCGVQCQGELTCLGGSCGCATGTRCGTQCVNTQTDEAHCGDCNDPCGSGETCQGGACVLDEACTPACRPDQICRAGACVCPSGQVSCGQPGSCVPCCFDFHCAGNPNGNQCIEDPARPGRPICGCRQLFGSPTVRPCGPSGACSICCSDDECRVQRGDGWSCHYQDAASPLAGHCDCDTENGYSECNNECANRQTDPAHCGACFNRCNSSADEVCCGGVCADLRSDADHCGACFSVCESPQSTCCFGRCFDIRSDNAHCGECGHPCPGELTCCTPTPPDFGFTRCTDNLTDSLHCGLCGNKCDDDQACCDGVCLNVWDDRNHCGDCERVCANDEECVEGRCVPSGG